MPRSRRRIDAAAQKPTGSTGTSAAPTVNRLVIEYLP
jgi:hypothetical protein